MIFRTFLMFIISKFNMSNNRIFTNGVRFEQQGRSANLANTVFRRSPIFNHVSNQKQEQSPFANYNCKIGQGLSNESETSILEQKINPDIVRQVVKEELAKLHSADDVNRKQIAIIQAQINDLRDKTAENEKENSLKLQDTTSSVKEEIKTETERIGKQVQIQISTKLRSFFQVANQQLKNDIIKSVQQDFLTITYGQDLQNRLQEMNQKIQSLLNININKQGQSQDIIKNYNQNLVSQNAQSRLKQTEKDIQNSKKMISQLMIKSKQMDEWVNLQKQRKEQKQLQTKLCNIEQKLKKYEQQSIRINNSIEAIKVKQKLCFDEISLFKSFNSENKKYIDNQMLIVADTNQKIELLTLKLNNFNQVNKNYNNLQKQVQINQNNQIWNKQQTNSFNQVKDYPIEVTQLLKGQNLPKKQTYQIDKQGYLMDGQGKYLLTEIGYMVKLSQQQIESVINSQVVEILQN